MDAAEIHERYGTPDCALIVLAVIVIIAIIIGPVYLLGGASASSAHQISLITRH